MAARLDYSVYALQTEILTWGEILKLNCKILHLSNMGLLFVVYNKYKLDVTTNSSIRDITKFLSTCTQCLEINNNK